MRTKLHLDRYRAKELDKGLSSSYVDELCGKYMAANKFLIVAGGRDFNNWDVFYANFYAWFDRHDGELSSTVILSGMAAGADSMGYLAAEDNGIPYEEYPAKWDLFGLAAGGYRNTQMACSATHLLAFWNKESTGTRDMISKANKIGLIIDIVYYDIPKTKQSKTLW